MSTNTPNPNQSFADQVHQQLNDLKASLEQVQSELRSENATAMANLSQQFHAEVEARRLQVDAAKARMKARLDQKKAETDAAVAEWKAKPDLQRLEARAKGDADYALAAIDNATASLYEAGAAIADAARSRLDAVKAKRNNQRAV